MPTKRRSKFKLRRVLALLGASYLFLIALVFFFGDNLVFFPDDFGDWKLPAETQEVRFGNPRLHAWFMEAEDAVGTVVVFHGNQGNIAGRKETFEQLRGIGLNVFAVDYRGYGKSEGSPSEEGFYEDALASWDYLVKERRISPDRLFVLGQSLGTSAATYLAANRSCAGVILEAPMTSVKRMAGRVVPFPPLAWALPIEMSNLDRMPSIKCPVLIVHGTDDGVIPFDEGEAVFAAAREPKRFVPIKGGDHNDLWDGRTDEYMSAIRQFVAAVD